VSSCEHRFEELGFIKCGENLLGSQEGLCFVGWLDYQIKEDEMYGYMWEKREMRSKF
jgi:hypothetical protein